MRYLLLALALLGCSSKDNTPRGLCERGCKKVLACMSAESEMDACVRSCVGRPPEQAKIEKLEQTACDAILADPSFAVPGGSPGAAPARNGCTADCRTCVGDGTSCFAAAGGTNGIPCDPCCCAPGGPAPTWRTPPEPTE